MKDLRSRWTGLILLFVTGTLLGCGVMQGNPSGDSSGSSALLVTPSLNFGSVVVGQSKTMSAVITNRTVFRATISQAASSDPQFQIVYPKLPITLRGGQSVRFRVRFAPQAAGSPSGTLAIAGSSAQSSSTIMLSAKAVVAGKLTPAAPSISFGSVKVGQQQTKTETFTNAGSTLVTITQVAVTGASFQLSGANTLPIAVDAGQSTSFDVVFSPKTAGGASGSMTVSTAISMSVASHAGAHAQGNTQSDTTSVTLSGTGTGQGQLTANPASVSFGSMQVGSSTSKAIVLNNSGTASVTISQATASGAGFTASGMNLPATLAAGQSATVNVTFAPKSGGSATGTLAIASNASNAALNVALSGSAATAGSLASATNIMAFGTVQVGSNQKQSATVTNSGGSSITINQASVTGSGFTLSGITTPVTLNAGQSATFSVTFAPQSAGSASGTATLTPSSGTGLSWSLSGSGVTAGALTASPSSLSFGSIPAGSSKTLPETLTNSGGSSVTISQASASGTGFSVTGLSLPATLDAGKSVSFNVVFSPTSGGNASSNLTIGSNASNASLTVPLSGSATTPGALTAGNSNLSFGNVVIGKSQTISETLTNSGGSDVTVTAATVTGSAFDASGLALPLTLAAGKSTSFNVVFNPASAGNASGSIAISSDASGSGLTIALSGTGVTPGTLSASNPSLSFGSVQTSSSKTMQETLTNSGGTSVTIAQATVSGTGFSISGLSLPLTLAAGTSKSFNVTFAPPSASSASGSLTVTSDATNPSLTVSLSGTGTSAPGVLGANPTSLSFGSVQVGDTSSKSAAFSNTGGSMITISQVSATGAGFSLTGLSLPLDLDAGQSFTFGVSFAPQAPGSVSGNISVTSNASNTLAPIPLSGSGTAVGQFAVSPASFGFGSVVVGVSKNMTATLSASLASVTVSSASVSSPEFTLTGPALPLTIPAGQSASFTITFTPQASGGASATASFVTNTPGSPVSASLSGTGTQPPQHRVDLNWSASTSSVVGYNVYRSNTSGSGYSKLNSATNAGTSYTDLSVQAGSTYFYVTTAVDSNGAESSFSNEVRALVPTP